ncbi:hypothetical protein H4R35_000609 [Dimargaris xerosporica]|nr:hypothetical protein H4R35_000609 [Dimargaris xerosporica]
MRFTSAAAALCLVTIMTVQSSMAVLPATPPTTTAPASTNQSPPAAVKTVPATVPINQVKDSKTVAPGGQHKNLTPQQKLAHAQERAKFWQERVTKLQGVTAASAAAAKSGQKAAVTTTTTPPPPATAPQPASKPAANTPAKV